MNIRMRTERCTDYEHMQLHSHSVRRQPAAYLLLSRCIDIGALLECRRRELYDALLSYIASFLIIEKVRWSQHEPLRKGARERHRRRRTERYDE
jgi:hypothetical protein